MFRLQPRIITWLKPNREKPSERGSDGPAPKHPPLTAGLDRFAESPVNGAKDMRLGWAIFEALTNCATQKSPLPRFDQNGKFNPPSIVKIIPVM
jgi:hypothetical protein